MQFVEQNLRETFQWLASRRPHGESVDTSGIALASAAVRFQMFNAAFLAPGQPLGDAELERRIGAARVHFSARGLDWAFWVCEHLLTDSAKRRSRRIFERHFLHPAANLPAMAAERLLPASGTLPELEIRRVSEGQTRLAFCAIGSACFRVPGPWFEEIFEPESIWTEPMAGYVGYVAGEPVATVLTWVSRDAAGVYNVATAPGHRRKGCAEALLRHALEQARQRCGVERTILQSTDDGFSLYERMGYRTVGRVGVYSSETH